jgi:3-isopropylmalate dehydrogenase
MGRGISNPIGTILSVAMMYRYSFNMEAVAAAIEQAVSIALDYKKDGGHEVWTGDLGGTAMTKDVGDKVILTLEPLLKS